MKVVIVNKFIWCMDNKLAVFSQTLNNLFINKTGDKNNEYKKNWIYSCDWRRYFRHAFSSWSCKLWILCISGGKKSLHWRCHVSIGQDLSNQWLCNVNYFTYTGRGRPAFKYWINNLFWHWIHWRFCRKLQSQNQKTGTKYHYRPLYRMWSLRGKLSCNTTDYCSIMSF